MTSYILNDQGHAVKCDDLLTWGEWFQNDFNRVLAQNRVNGVFLSTVFLGIDHRFTGFDGPGPPILWETMVFGGRYDQFQCRYSSATDARRNHKYLLNRIRKNQNKKARHHRDQAAFGLR